MMKITIFLSIFLICLNTVIAEESSDKWEPETIFEEGFYTPILLTSLGLVYMAGDGLLSSKDVNHEFREHIPKGYYNPLDDFTRLVPLALLMAIDLSGYDTHSKLLDQAMITAETCVLVTVGANLIKRMTRIKRPDGSDYLSFPSGHTTIAFALAQILANEMPDSYVFPALGYCAAISTGVLRMVNNKHYFSDVLVGAALGMVLTDFVYDLNKRNKEHGGDIRIYPVWGGEDLGMAITYQF